ncbi:MAG: hypothetical protein NT132_09090 [Microbacterium sp.]|uniref:hypothetical protein n=1 Tax=Microbacterium sp. TaxID=51671 RepID=UPI0026319883|nr:hypothetical protein [Microbacterium sp.]MCX6502540.1 hypothetical protein [Microbacterium sp.]
MRGKAGLIIGLAAGYVLGTRAGHERYEQIKEQALKVWNLDPVQKQVAKVEQFGKSAIMALPSTLWKGAQKVTAAATTKGTPGQRLDAAIDAGEDAAKDVADAAETSAEAVKDAAENTATAAKKAASKAGSTASKAGSTASDTSSTGK